MERVRNLLESLPQPTDSTHCGSHLLGEGRKKVLDRRNHRSQKDIPITDFFNTHSR
jgi:hypothetical protein